MKIYSLLLPVILLNSTVLCAQDRSLTNPEFNAQLNTLLREQHVPSVAVGLIENNEVVATEVYGLGSDLAEAPAQLLFSVASLTKPVSMMAALSLASSGHWSLDEPLANYWIDPDLKDDSVVYQLTSRHVLSHQGGFTNWRTMRADGKLAFETRPGTTSRYSGEGFEYLRRAMEKKFHQPFEELVASALFKTLKMHHSFLTWPKQVDTLSYAGRFDKDGERYPFEQVTAANAAASLITTIQDYSNFAAACLKGLGVSDELNNEIHTPQIEVPQARDVGIGLSWVVVEKLEGGEYALMHSGSDPGIKTLVVLLPVSKRGLVIFTNGDNGQKVYEALLSRLLDVGDEILARMK